MNRLAFARDLLFSRGSGRAGRVALAAGLLGCFLLPAAQAIIVGAGRFDQMIQNSDVIVKFQVTAEREAPSEMIGFAGSVLSVLKTDGGRIPNELELEAAGPIWPIDLGLDATDRQPVIVLVLKRWDGSLHVDWNMHAILPAVEGPVACANTERAERRIGCELHAFLETLADGLPKARVLALMAQVADSSDRDVFLRHLQSSHPRVRQAARAGAARLDPQPERIQAVVEDFKAHLASSDPDEDVREIQRDVVWASRGGSFGMDAPLAARAQAYLPVFRVLVDEAENGSYWISVGVEGLKNVGTPEDLERLWRFRDHDQAWMRHNVYEGLGRILGVPCKRPQITSYGMSLPPEVAVWEQETRAVLEQRLKARLSVP